IDHNGIRLGLDVVMEIAQDGIVFQQVGQRFGIGEVVDRHKFQLAIINGGAQHVAPDAAESVDADFDCHASLRKKSENTAARTAESRTKNCISSGVVGYQSSVIGENQNQDPSAARSLSRSRCSRTVAPSTSLR